MYSERWLPIAAGAGVFLFLFALLPPAKVPLWVVNLSGVSAEDAATAYGGVELTYSVEPDYELGEGEVMDWTLEVLQARLDARGIDGASVLRKDDYHLTVRLPGVAEDEAQRLRDMLHRRGTLEFRVVEHDSPAMRAAAEQARYDGKAVREDTWYTPRGETVRDLYLTASTREELELFLSLFADDDVSFGYEHVTASDYAAERERPTDHWRSYALRRQPNLDSTGVGGASLTFDETTNQPQVMVDFTIVGSELFERMTGDYTGHKLAIVLDGEIKSAPVIQDRIGGGRAVVSMGYDKDAATLEARARDLVAVLEAGRLPTGLVLEDERVISPGLTEAGMWTARALFALMIGLLVGGAAFGAQLLAQRYGRQRADTKW